MSSRSRLIGVLTLVITVLAWSPALLQAQPKPGREPLKIGFNASYLLDFLGALDAETVVVDLQDETSPGLFRGVGEEGLLGVIMPMRI